MDRRCRAPGAWPGWSCGRLASGDPHLMGDRGAAPPPIEQEQQEHDASIAGMASTVVLPHTTLMGGDDDPSSIHGVDPCLLRACSDRCCMHCTGEIVRAIHLYVRLVVAVVLYLYLMMRNLFHCFFFCVQGTIITGPVMICIGDHSPAECMVLARSWGRSVGFVISTSSCLFDGQELKWNEEN